MSSSDVLSLVRVDPTSDASIASQLRSQLEWLIARGVLREGDQLPPIRDFSQRLGVNYHTLRGVYRQLGHDGLVDSQRGRGTTVLDYRNARRTIGPRSAPKLRDRRHHPDAPRVLRAVSQRAGLRVARSRPAVHLRRPPRPSTWTQLRRPAGGEERRRNHRCRRDGPRGLRPIASRRSRRVR